MIFSARLKQILLMLLNLEEGQYMTIDELAEKMAVSRRTIFREVKDIDFLLEPYDLRFATKSKKGVMLEGSAEKKRSLLDDLQVNDVPYINRTERQKLLAYELLHNTEIRKLIYYANMFQVSEATISNDIEALEPFFEQYHIRIERQSKSRISMLANESSRREAMTAIVRERMNLSSQSNPFTGLDVRSDLQQLMQTSVREGILKLLNQKILAKVIEIFTQNSHELGLDRFSNSSYLGLLIHLVIAIDRIQHYESLSQSEEVLELARADASYADAVEIAQIIEAEFDLEMPDVEIGFIAFHLKGAKMACQKEDLAKPDENLKKIIDEMILSFDSQIAYRLAHDDKFLQGFMTHLEPTIVRLQHHLPIYNPMLEQLKVQYHDLFEQSRQAARVLEEHLHTEVSEEEIGFITMHVGASLERSQPVPVRRVIPVGIVCASGIGVSALLAARVEKAFASQVRITTLSLEDLNSEKSRNLELLLSTFDIKGQDTEVLQISPLLSEKDIDAIQKRLNILHQSSGSSERIETNIGKDLRFLAEASQTALQILDLLQCLQIPSDFAPEEIIFQASRLLRDNHERIQNDLLERERLGSVISQDFGFAMFHAATPGASAPQILIFYPDAAEFSSLALQGIEFIIVSVIPKPYTSSQQKMMSIISSSLIDNEEFYEAIAHRDEAKIQAVLQQILYQYIYERI